MKTITISRAEYDMLKSVQAQVAALQEEINRLTEQIRLARKQRFGASSEKSQPEDGSVHLSYLFNEPECMARVSHPETDMEEVAVKAHARKARRCTQENLPEDIEVEVIEKALPEKERVCPQCQGQLSDIGSEATKRLKIIPARFVVEETRVHKYACRYCQEHDITTPVKAADSNPPVIKGSIATPEAIAHVMTQKFVMYSPLYRQEQEYGRAGVPLSRQTMSNWLLRAASQWLRPVYERMKTELVKQDILHADETTVQVLHEPGKKAQSKSYMWLYRTGREEPQQLVLYEYRQSCEAKHPETFLKDYRGYLHADGYAVYYGLPGVTVASCWAHVRRKFDEALQSISKKDTAKGSNALRGKQYCDSLFAIESEINGLLPEERLEQRQKRAKPILEDFHDWLFHLNDAPKSLLGSAVHYARKLWPWLTNYLLDGRLEISNNRAERSIKPFVMGRKNFLFANVPKGAEASAIIYSLIETAKENELDPYRYLTWLMHEAPMLDMANLQAILDFVSALEVAGVGENIVAGIGDAMAQAGWEDPAETTAGNLETAINAALGIESPSTRMIPVGQNAAAGVGQGFAEYDICRARADEKMKLAEYEFKKPPLLTDEEIEDILGKLDDLTQWANEIAAYAQAEALNGKQWKGWKIVEGRSNRKYTDEEAVVEAAYAAGYRDIHKKTLLPITEMEKLMGREDFKAILGSLVCKPPGKPALVPSCDKRPALSNATNEFREIKEI